MDAQEIGSVSGYQGQGQSKFIQPKQSNLIAIPVVKTDDGKLSVSPEIMAGIWQQIVNEDKRELLFYDGAVRDLQQWINYIYNPANYVVLIVNEDTGYIHHIAWINKFYQGSGFVHHCSLGPYNRQVWPTLKKILAEHERRLRYTDY